MGNAKNPIFSELNSGQAGIYLTNEWPETMNSRVKICVFQQYEDQCLYYLHRLSANQFPQVVQKERWDRVKEEPHQGIEDGIGGGNDGGIPDGSARWPVVNEGFESSVEERPPFDRISSRADEVVDWNDTSVNRENPEGSSSPEAVIKQVMLTGGGKNFIESGACKCKHCLC